MLVLTASTLSSCHVTDIFASSETHVPKKSTHYNIFSVQMGLFVFFANDTDEIAEKRH